MKLATASISRFLCENLRRLHPPHLYRKVIFCASFRLRRLLVKIKNCTIVIHRLYKRKAGFPHTLSVFLETHHPLTTSVYVKRGGSMTIRTKLTIAFFLLLVVISGAFFFAAIRIVTTSWSKVKINDNLSLTVDEAEEVSIWIKDKTAEVTALSRFDALRSNNSAQIKQALQSLRSPLNGINTEKELFFLDQTGNVLYSDNVLTSGLDEVELARKALGVVRNTQTAFVDGFLISEETRRALVLFCAPRWSKQGAFLGTLNALIDFGNSRAGESLKNLRSGQGARLFLIDSLGTILLATEKDFFVGKEPYWEAILKTNSLKGKIVNDTLLVTFARISRMPWWISIHQPQTQLTSEIREVERTLFWVGGVGALLSLAIAIALSRSLSKPIEALITRTEQLRKGTFSPLEEQPSGEIGQLVASFNEMATSIQKSHKKLSSLNELGAAIISDIRLNSIFEHICQRVTEVMETESCSIYLVDPDNVLRIKASIGLSEEERLKLQFEVSENITKEVFHRRKGTIINDVANDPRSTFIPHRPKALKLLSIPLLVRDEPRGVMNIHNKKNNADFTQDDLEILSAFSHQATLAIENFRLFKEVTKELQRVNELQAQLIQSEKLSAIGQLVAGVAHEINNPLAIILGYTDLLLQRTTDSTAIKSLATIRQAVERTASIVRNLLSFARKQEPKLVPLNINDIMQSVLDLLQYQLKSHHIALFCEFDPKLENIQGDIQQLQQVFLNLLTNAMHAMEGAKDARLTVTTRQRDNVVTVSVSDNGQGIKPEHITKIFEPFFTTKEIGKGTGLGLSICYGIIKELRGEITVNSQPGKETTFVVELPVVRTDGTVNQYLKPSDSDTSIVLDCNVLVVDDEEDLRAWLKHILESHGCRVRVASNGSEGLQALKEDHIDVIISDMKMPEMNGDEFYQRCIREYPRYAQRFIFSSGDTVPNEGAERFYQSTACEIIHKPFAAHQIIEKVKLVASK